MTFQVLMAQTGHAAALELATLLPRDYSVEVPPTLEVEV